MDLFLNLHLRYRIARTFRFAVDFSGTPEVELLLAPHLLIALTMSQPCTNGGQNWRVDVDNINAVRRDSLCGRYGGHRGFSGMSQRHSRGGSSGGALTRRTTSKVGMPRLILDRGCQRANMAGIGQAAPLPGATRESLCRILWQVPGPPPSSASIFGLPQRCGAKAAAIANLMAGIMETYHCFKRWWLNLFQLVTLSVLCYHLA